MSVQVFKYLKLFVINNVLLVAIIFYFFILMFTVFYCRDGWKTGKTATFQSN